MKISIVIPVYNVEDYIIACLESVVRQTTRLPLEVIIVDDCGKDRSIAMAEEFIRSYDGPIEFHIIRHQHNMGLSCARNTGTNSATGDYILYIDSDDTISDNCIEELAKPLAHFEYDFVQGGCINTNGEPLIFVKELLPDGEYAGTEIMRHFSDTRWASTAWNKLLKKDFLVTNNLYFEPGMLHEDAIWSFFLSCKAQRMFMNNSITYIYNNQRNGSISNIEINKEDIQWKKRIMEFNSKNVVSQGLQNNRYVYYFLNANIYMICDLSRDVYSSEERKQLYKEMRANSIYKRIDYFRYSLRSVKRAVQNIHLLFPTSLGLDIIDMTINLKHTFSNK